MSEPSAIILADRPAPSRIVAVVFLKLCEVTQLKPARSSAARTSRRVFLGSRNRDAVQVLRGGRLAIYLNYLHGSILSDRAAVGPVVLR